MLSNVRIIGVFMYDYGQTCTTSTIQEGVLEHPHSHFFLQSSLQVWENPLNPTSICLMTTNSFVMIAHVQHKEGKWTCNGSSYSIQEEHLCLLLIHHVCLSHQVSVSDWILVDKYTGREANIHIQWSWRYEIYFFVFLKK